MAENFDMLLEHGVGGGDLAQNDVINPKTGVGPWLGICLFEQACVDDGVMQDQAPTASEVEIDYLDIGIDPANVLLTRKLSGNDSHEPRESDVRRDVPGVTVSSIATQCRECVARDDGSERCRRKKSGLRWLGNRSSI